MSNELVQVPREQIRLCDRCNGPLQMGILTRVTIDSLALTESSVRAVAGMEMHFGPGHERLASVMAPPIEATQGMQELRVLCFDCTVKLMEFIAEYKRPLDKTIS